MKVVVFSAPCPGCGADCRWTQHERENARVQAEDFAVACPCQT